MPTFTALTTLPGQPAAEALGAAMERLDPEPTGIGVFEVEDGSGLWEVGGYFLGKPDAAGLALLAASFGAAPFAVSELPDTDWVAEVQRELAPVEAGRFFVYGAHDAEKLPEGRVGLLIEAAMAFGTGHHGTTLGCLRMLDQLVEAGTGPVRVLDLGCGTAVLAMAAAKVFDVQPLASDIDPVAIEVAEANLRANGLEGRVTCVVAEGFGDPALAEGPAFDLVFANILKGPLLALAPDIAARTNPGAHVILSGLLNDQADDISAHYARHGINPIRRERIGDWTTFLMRRDAP